MLDATLTGAGLPGVASNALVKKSSYSISNRKCLVSLCKAGQRRNFMSQPEASNSRDWSPWLGAVINLGRWLINPLPAESGPMQSHPVSRLYVCFGILDLVLRVGRRESIRSQAQEILAFGIGVLQDGYD